VHLTQTSRFYLPLIALVSVLLIGDLAASQQIAGGAGYRDLSYPEDTGSNSRPTGEKPESKLWFTVDPADPTHPTWWGILWSTPFEEYRIHKLDLTTQEWSDTGTAVDDRSKTRSDVLWDGTSSVLYVASHVFSSSGAPSTKKGDWGRLYRFTYNTGTKTYTPTKGFPVDVTGGKSETLVLAKDTKGTLWVTYVESNQVMVNHSLDGDDGKWRLPFALPGAALENSEAGKVTDDISTIIAFNGHVGIMWSHQTYNNLGTPVCAGCNIHSGHEEGDTDHLTSITMNFAVHDDGAPDSVWSSSAIYTASGDDHISLKAYDGHVYAAYKEAGLAKQIGLLDCDAAVSGCGKKTDWKHYPVFKRKDNDGNGAPADLKSANAANPTRPTLLIDTTHRDLYIFVSVEQGVTEQSSIRYKKASIDRIRFPTDDGVPFITTNLLNTDVDSVINDSTSTKQNLNSTTGLVVLASDGVQFQYFHNYLPLK
jgi:hypothetical protein